MPAIFVQDGKIIFRDGKVGTEQACCCEDPQSPPPQACDEIFGGNGWYTASEQAALNAFLEAAGYQNPTYTQVPANPAPFPFPYESPCGQVFYELRYECCGVFGSLSGCDPLFITEKQTVQIGGNQQPPCNTTTFENFLFVCCEEEPPP